ncbi:MAG: ABC transporter ATP-binding protein [Nitrospinota bacterium]|nr:ABC transporter ATP-binding protein [Nitrospinota bacterium]
MSQIELKKLRKVFGENIEAVKDLDLVIEEGEFVVLVGPSGCGKTTTLRMIAGFEEPTSGEVVIDGEMVNDRDPKDRNLGMVFQSHALFPHKTVYQNIEFGPRMKKIPLEDRKKRVEEVAEMVHITPLLNKLPSQCSGGEAQRAALARTLITNPGSFLLDEPLSSLDAKLRREMRAEIDRLHQELKKTFVYVTHDQEEAMTLADRIVVMRAGEIEQEGIPMEIYNDPSSYFVADFFGSPSMNLLDGNIRKGSSGESFVFEGYGLSLDLPRLDNLVEGEHCVGIRPESISVGDSDNGLELSVSLVEPMGKDTLLYFSHSAERPLIAVVEGSTKIQSGDLVVVQFPKDSIYVFDSDGIRVK